MYNIIFSWKHKHINDAKEHAIFPHCKHIGFPPKYVFESHIQLEKLHVASRMLEHLDELQPFS